MTLPDQLSAARRELALRRRVYPNWIRANRMSTEKAKHEIEAMEAIVQTLEKVTMLDEAGLAWISEPNTERSGGDR